MMINAGSEVTVPFDQDTFVGMKQELLSRIIAVLLKH